MWATSTGKDYLTQRKLQPNERKMMSNSNQNMSFNNYVAVRYLGDLIPTGGRGTPVAPPTYIGREEKAPEIGRAHV